MRSGCFFVVALFFCTALSFLLGLQYSETEHPARYGRLQSHRFNRILPVAPTHYLPPPPLGHRLQGKRRLLRLPTPVLGTVPPRHHSAPTRAPSSPRLRLDNAQDVYKRKSRDSIPAAPLNVPVQFNRNKNTENLRREPRTQAPIQLRRGREASSHGADFTLVTGLFDIGRGEWWLYRRPYDVYLRYLSNLLRLEVNMVVFIQPKGADFVRSFRDARGLLSKTHIVPMELEQIELYARYWLNATGIIEKEKRQWNPRWDVGIKPHPEASSAEYNLVVNSKPFLLSLAARLDPFHSAAFYWLDSGYGHGQSGLFPADNRWCPSSLLSQEGASDRISIVQLVPEPSIERQTIDDLYRQDRALVSGGFFGGSKARVFELYHRYTALFTHLLSQGYLDDDQTVMVLLIGKFPDLFNAVYGDWFDGVSKAHCPTHP